VHAEAIAVGDRVPIEGLGLGDVGAGVGAPDLADDADGAGPPAEQRAVGLPVDLLVLEADDGNRGVRALLERAALPAVDQVVATIMALDTFLGMLLGFSSGQFMKSVATTCVVEDNLPKG
jgi:hypothetical protein